MKPNQIEKEILEKFDKKFNNIDVNECEYNDDGEPDNMVIIDSEGLRRNGLKSVRQFISDYLSTYRTQVEKENDVNIQNAYLKGISDGRKNILQEVKDKMMKEKELYELKSTKEKPVNGDKSKAWSNVNRSGFNDYRSQMLEIIDKEIKQCKSTKENL